jgi:hypothetical protein
VGDPEAARRRAVAAWRWLTALVGHGTSRQDPLWGHGLTPYVLSIGAGSCGDNAVALCRLWQRQGLEARVWQLDGHIVPEVLVGDRWEVYDPDLDVAYTDRAGEVAGVAELAADPTLVLRPQRLAPARSIHALLQRHATPTARAYAGTAAHRVLVVDPDAGDPASRLPPGAELRLADDGRAVVVELVDGVLRLPMVLLEARGPVEGDVTAGSSHWQVEATGPATVTLLANPRVWVPGDEPDAVVPVDRYAAHLAEAQRSLGDDGLDLLDEAAVRLAVDPATASLLAAVRAADVPPADARLSAGSVAAFASAAAAGRGDEVLAYVRSALA